MNRLLIMFMILIVLLISLSWGGIALAGNDVLKIDDFEDGLSAKWQPKVFAGQTEYQVVSDQEGSCLHATSQGSASGLVYEIEFDPNQYPLLSWRWKVSNLLAKGDGRTKQGDDYAARVYVIFPHWFFPKTRTLNYIWANRLPEGSIQPNAYTGNAMMLAVRSGPEYVGRWVSEERNLAEDFRRAFGEEPPLAGAIAVMTDTDNTGEVASACYDDFALRKTPNDEIK